MKNSLAITNYFGKNPFAQQLETKNIKGVFSLYFNSMNSQIYYKRKFLDFVLLNKKNAFLRNNGRRHF
jgi:hypothetical protein